MDLWHLNLLVLDFKSGNLDDVINMVVHYLFLSHHSGTCTNSSTL